MLYRVDEFAIRDIPEPRAEIDNDLESAPIFVSACWTVAFPFGRSVGDALTGNSSAESP